MPNRREEGCLSTCRKRMTGRVIGVILLGVLSVVIIVVAIVMHTLPSKEEVEVPPPFLQLHPIQEDGDTPLIYIDAQGNWKSWIESELDEYLKRNDNKSFETIGQFVSDCSQREGESAPNKTWCVFDNKLLGSKCSREGLRVYGFDAREPCFYLNPNEFEGWEPEYYKNISEIPEEVPKDLLETMKNATDLDGQLPARLWISCEGKTPADMVNMGPIQYLPHPYYESYYFPYKKGPGYFVPIVAVHFSAVEPDVSIHVMCRVWAKNVENMRPSVQWEMIFD